MVLPGLLDGGKCNAFKAFQIESAAGGAFTVEKMESVAAEFGRLFYKPLHALSIFGGCHCQVNFPGTESFNALNVGNFKPALADFFLKDPALASPAFAIGQLKQISFSHPEYLQRMLGLCLRKNFRFKIWEVKQGHA
jgi:hypothetical protein